ncbi:hypothetical protein AB0M35_21130 [Micromonospora sp. NPDC051196]|uniref:hypothetical protein n=1 Tax=Micromonospora sp. NPDC051196 TaxID=3155281 RepID=UPI0034388F26
MAGVVFRVVVFFAAVFFAGAFVAVFRAPAAGRVEVALFAAACFAGAFFAVALVAVAFVAVAFVAVAFVAVALVAVAFVAVALVAVAFRAVAVDVRAGVCFVAAVVFLAGVALLAVAAVRPDAFAAVVFFAAVFAVVVFFAAVVFFAVVARFAGALLAALFAGALLAAVFFADAFFAGALVAVLLAAEAPAALPGFCRIAGAVPSARRLDGVRVRPAVRSVAAVLLAGVRFAAGRVACCASAISVPSLGTCHRPRGARGALDVGGVPRRLLLLPGPAGVLGLPRVVTLPHLLQGVLRVGGRGVRSENVPGRTHVGLGLDSMVSRTPVVAPTSAVAHGITVHR